MQHMMKTKVWFTPLEDREPAEGVGRKAARLAEAAGLKHVVQADGLIGILQHVGEGDNVGHVEPPVTRAIAKKIAARKGTPFLTGTATLYRGRRSNACDHLMQAYDHGFTPEAIGCPIVMVDGLRGSDQVSVRVPSAKHCATAYLGSGVAVLDGLVAITHPTGHVGAGFAAAIKNVSMGLSSRGGKLAMHHGSYPIFLPERCTACGRCVQWCPADAITLAKTAKLDKKKCIGCGECFSVCPSDAIDFSWRLQGQGFQEGMVEYCAAVQSKLGDRILFLNVIRHFQKGCDCMGTPEKAVCPDVGLVASRDIVAVDTATADLLHRATGKDIVREVADCDYRGMLAYAESMDLGSRDYELIEIKK